MPEENIIENNDEEFIVEITAEPMYYGDDIDWEVVHRFEFEKGVEEIWLETCIQDGEDIFMALDEIPPGIQSLVREETGMRLTER